MNRIIFPLNREIQGPNVGDLQDALRLLMERNVLLANEPDAMRELSPILQDERSTQSFGDATAKLVLHFQREHRLQRSGDVDQQTADLLNSLLAELGLLNELPAQAARLVIGTVRRDDGLPLPDVRVRAYLQVEQGSIRLGEDSTDTDGRYTIGYQLPPDVQNGALRISVVGETGDSLSDSVSDNPLPLETIDLIVPLKGLQNLKQRIEGSIVLEHGMPVDGLKLRLYRRDFGGAATLLQESNTLEGGRYAFAYDSPNPASSLEVRAVNSDELEIPLSRPLNEMDDESRLNLNLIAPAELQPLAAEYRRMTADLLPHLGSSTKLAEAREDSEQQDITVLNRATGWDARLIALAATTERLAAEPDVTLPQETIYGLLRAGLPSDKLLLAQVEPDIAMQALTRVRDVGLIKMSDVEIEQTKTDFINFSNNTLIKLAVPGSRSTYSDLLESSGLDQNSRDKFAPIFLRHRGDGEELWAAAKVAGLADAQINTLQIQGKFAFLAGNSEPMTARLLGKRLDDPSELMKGDFHQTEKWIDEVFDQAGIPATRRTALSQNDRAKLDAIIPPTYAAESIENRLELYADDMARKTRLSYPTHVLGRLLETDEKFQLASDHASTVKLLNKSVSKGFRFGETPVAKFLTENPDLMTAVNGESEFRKASKNLNELQRVYQITPDDDSMTVLMNLGITSAYDVTAYSERMFEELFVPKYIEIHERRPDVQLAPLIYRKAKQVSSVIYNLFTIAKKMESEPPVAALSAPVQVRESVKDNLIKQFPTMESLFGSMDYCECQHCRSVLSPAAYLVDLLQFVDTGSGVWGNFLAHWSARHGGAEYKAEWDKKPDHSTRRDIERKPFDALIERRPDLPHIPLTCENTHTVMPYIDIVNEILEYYVANGKLQETAARDTGDATTADLLAEPQNVIREAYDKVRDSYYPLNLPFDLWLETVRQFCNYFETPLPKVLESFRPDDDLIAPANSFDRLAIFTESLGISPSEMSLFANPNPLANWYELYGFDSAENAMTVAVDQAGQRIDLNSAKALSRRLGVTYKEITEIVQTGFVNPELDKLDLLYKLGVSISDARFYQQRRIFLNENRDLLDANRSELSTADRKRFDNLANKVAPLQKSGWDVLHELAAFEKRLADLAISYGTTSSALQSSILEIPYDKILVLADPDSGCNFDLTTLQYSDGEKADDIAFLRINLFVRLWRKLGWSIEETDRALQIFVPHNTPYDTAHVTSQPLRTAIVYLAHLKTLDESIKVGKNSRIKLLSFWSDIATTGKNSLYSQLFLNRSVLQNDPVFDNPLGQYLTKAGLAIMANSRVHSVQLQDVLSANKIDPLSVASEPRLEVSYDELLNVQHLSFKGVLNDADKATILGLSPSTALPQLLDAVQIQARDFSLIKGHTLALQGALGLASDDIVAIMNDDDAGVSADEAELSLANVSRLYRYGILAKGLGLSVRELITLKRLSGVDPFHPINVAPLTALEQDHPFSNTLEFVKVAGEVRESGLSIEDLEFLLRHRFDVNGKYRQDPVAIHALFNTLSNGIRTIRAEHSIPVDPGSLSDEVLRQKLGLVLPADVIARFISLMNGTAEFSISVDASLESQLHINSFGSASAIVRLTFNQTTNKQTLVFRGILFDAQEQALKNEFSSTLTTEQNAVFTALLVELKNKSQDEGRGFFDRYLKRQPVNDTVSTGFLDSSDFILLFEPALSGLNDSERQNRERNRRGRLSSVFFPFLQQRVIQQLIVQSMVAHTGATAGLVELLLANQQLLGGTTSLLDRFGKAGDIGVTATFFSSNNATGPALSSISLSDANSELLDNSSNPLKPPGTNSARLEGFLEVPASGAYRFKIHLEKKNAKAILRFHHLAEPKFLDGMASADDTTLGTEPIEFLELNAGTLYRFSLELHKLNGGNARLLVMGETLPLGPLTQLTMYPAREMESAVAAIGLLKKVLQIVQALQLGEREIRYVLSNPSSFGSMKLGTLPTQLDESAASEVAAANSFKGFRSIASYARLKRELVGGTEDLIGIFEANAIHDSDRFDKLVYPLIANLLQRDVATVKSTSRALFKSPDFSNEKSLNRLWEALQVVERFGVPVASILNWTRIVNSSTKAQPRFEIARELKEAIKARFEPETWQRVAQPIFDRLRQRQRDALVSHVMHQQHFDRIEQLFEYFLIDPGMEPVVQTSRIRLAISSLQIFIQRCLLNLESNVHPSTINSKQWEWMKRYRVWEANRKIFLFPENWLEPEFRDDKTHLFTELEGALLQGDVSSDLVDDAFLNYLRKLDELARLDIVAMHIEDNADPVRRILHVFGRTYSQPHKYFYRRYVKQMWTPWEPVSAEIEGNHLAPIVWRDRLYLFWVTFLEKAAVQDDSSRTDVAAIKYSAAINNPAASQKNPVTSAGSGKQKSIAEMTLSELKNQIMLLPLKSIDVQLHWCEYLNGEWASRESGPSISKSVPVEFNSTSVFIHVSKEDYENGEERGVYINMDAPINKAFYLAGRNSAPESRDYNNRPANPFSNASKEIVNRFSGSGAFNVGIQERITTEPDKTPAKAHKDILRKSVHRGARYTLLPCNNDLTALGASPDAYQDAENVEAVKKAIESGLGEIASLMKPVFYQDNLNTFFVESEVTERTIEEWGEWITKSPLDQGAILPYELEQRILIPDIPRIPGVPVTVDPIKFPVNPGSVINPRSGKDWLLNQVTVVRFDGVLIGPAGQPGIEVQSILDKSSSAVTLRVNSGSELSGGSVVILRDEIAFDKSGLQTGTAGLNIIGSGGLNQVLETNLADMNRTSIEAGIQNTSRITR